MARKLKNLFLFLTITLFGFSYLLAEPYKSLSDYNFFTDLKNQIPSNNTIPYKIANPLFSDYSYKFRFINFPNEQPAKYSYEDTFYFPAGVTIIKTFAYPIDEEI